MPSITPHLLPHLHPFSFNFARKLPHYYPPYSAKFDNHPQASVYSFHQSTKMSTLLKPIPVRTALLRQQMHIFTPQEFGRMFAASPWATKYFLEQQVHQGLFTRLKQGVYTLTTDPASEQEIANKLYQPSYISFAYALAYYHIFPEMVYQVTSATTKPTRIFTTPTHAFTYFTIKIPAYTGYYLTQTDTTRFLIAEPEKALVDYLYFHSLGKKTFPALDRLDLASINRRKANEYARLFGRKKLLRLLNQVYV